MTLPDGIQLYRLSEADAGRLQALMYRIYPAAYEYLWQDGGRWYLERMYAVDRLREELNDTNAHCWLLLGADGEELGFLKLLPHDLADAEGRGLCLQRLYLLPRAQGQGLGQQLMRYTFDWARRHDYHYIWLEAMEVGRARQFYARYGFTVRSCRRLDFPGMLDDRRGLLLMQAAVPQAVATE